MSDPIGRLLTRREVLALLGAGSLGMMARPDLGRAESAAGRSGCIVRPEQTEGPYFVDERLHRGDLRSDPADGAVKPGVPLELTLIVARLAGGRCEPLPGAQVDLWQCDHRGVYSGVEDPRFDTRGRGFLRGYQISDGEGRARFTTIYPGWYPGRTVHIHFKIRSPIDRRTAHEFTSQLYFDDALTRRVHALPPYAGRSGRATSNERDGIYLRGGSELLLDVRPRGEGYAGSFQVAMTS